MNKLMKFLEMEKLTDYTCNSEYLLQRSKLMTQKGRFMELFDYRSNVIDIEGIMEVYLGNLREHKQVINIKGIREVYLGNLREHKQRVQEAFNMKMWMTMYWKIVVKRFVDSMALHLHFSMYNLVTEEMEKEIEGDRRHVTLE
ncbi:hypothetical protein NL676_035424 [Syzygium grande]|nr:hypothetical protein NL676_035424 [Syzygium grande]